MYNTTSSHYVFRRFDIQHKHPLLKKNKFSYIKKDSGIIRVNHQENRFVLCQFVSRIQYDVVLNYKNNVNLIKTSKANEKS